MSNPARAPVELTATQFSMSVAPDAYLPDGFRTAAKGFKSTNTLTALFAYLDMDVMPTVVVPKEHTVAASVLSKDGPAFALATAGVPEPRVRTNFAKALINQAFGVLPETGLLSKETVGEKMRKTVYVSGGTETAVGRIAAAYPRRGVRPARPVQRAEATWSMVSCGLTLGHLPSHALRPYPLLPAEGEDGVKVNPNSDNGFPVLGKWNTPDAAAKCMALAVAVRDEIRLRGDGERWLREQEERRPWLVAVRGKAKADYYPQEKVVEARMRFYNAFPRPVMLNMQVATQVMEQSSRSILKDSRSHSAIGITLVRGGAAELIEAMELQLVNDGAAFVHVGDDSFVVVRRGAVLVLFALDCSNFDLTQHAAVTAEVHLAMAQELARIDTRASELWYGYARERVVVVSGASAYRWRHAGPSGMPLQSKVNDVLMDVLIHRVLAALPAGELTEATVHAVLQATGKDMGFVLKVEQYWAGPADSLLEALEQRPFLFIGYYFHVRGGKVLVCADVPRTYAQVPYPSVKWAKQKEELQVMEAMRLGSIALNLGIPPAAVDASFAAFRASACSLLRETIGRYGDSCDPRLRWAVSESPWGASTEPSLSGLLAAVERDPYVLWAQKEAPLPSVSQFIGGGDMSWATLVEEDEEQEANAGAGTSQRPLGLMVRRAELRPGRVPTHPATLNNVGRPPPTAVWGPNKERRAPAAEAVPSRRARRRDGITAREFEEAAQDYYARSEDDDEVGAYY